MMTYKKFQWIQVSIWFKHKTNFTGNKHKKQSSNEARKRMVCWCSDSMGVQESFTGFSCQYEECFISTAPQMVQLAKSKIPEEYQIGKTLKNVKEQRLNCNLGAEIHLDIFLLQAPPEF